MTRNPLHQNTTMNTEHKALIQSTLSSTKRVLIKIGTRVIDDKTTHLNEPVMKALVADVVMLMNRGIEVVLVSSGAVGMGLRTLNVSGRPASVPLRQAYAAVGQCRLMEHYIRLFESHQKTVAQVLLTRNDLDRRETYLNARETLQHLLTIGVVPIINENDTVAIEELTFGDNDMLGALVAGDLEADLMVLLTSIDGLYQDFDTINKSGRLIEFMECNNTEVDSWVDVQRDPLSMGGMQSKLDAGRQAASQGVMVAIANGLVPGIIGQMFSPTPPLCTWIFPREKKLGAWKYYLAFAKKPCGGHLVLDDGAVSAIRDGGKSLLASGIQRFDGRFDEKDLVQLMDSTEREIARGLVNQSSGDLVRLLQESGDSGLNDRSNVVVHRNNLVLTH